MMDIRRELDERPWREFVDSHPQGNVFHTPEMYQVFDLARGHRPSLWAAVDGGELLALLLPVQSTVFDGLLQPFTSRAVVYGGPLAAPGEAGGQALARLLDAYKQEVRSQVLLTEMRNLSDLEVLQPVLNEQGFAYEDHLNYLIDLDRTPEEILASVTGTARNQIRRALRRGQVTLTTVTDRALVAACYRVLELTYQRLQVPLADVSLFEAAFDVLHPRNMVRFSLAEVDGQTVGTAIDLLYRDVAFGWYGGLDREFGSYLVNELLTWNNLQWGARHGYRTYDFGGAGKPDEDYGPRHFKAKFGGELVSYGRNTCVHAPLRLPISKLGYQIYRTLRTRLPSRAVKWS